MNSTIKIILTQTGPLTLTEDAHGILRPEIPLALRAEGWEELRNLFKVCSVESAWESADGWELMSSRGSTIDVYTLLKPLEGSNEKAYMAVCDAIDQYLSDFGTKVVLHTQDLLAALWSRLPVKLEPQVQGIVVSKDSYNCGTELGEWVDQTGDNSITVDEYMVEEVLCEECRKAQSEKALKRSEN